MNISKIHTDLSVNQKGMTFSFTVLTANHKRYSGIYKQVSEEHKHVYGKHMVLTFYQKPVTGDTYACTTSSQ
jgi:hypothetical protein